jgi:hypothetical protein
MVPRGWGEQGGGWRQPWSCGGWQGEGAARCQLVDISFSLVGNGEGDSGANFVDVKENQLGRHGFVETVIAEGGYTGFLLVGEWHKPEVVKDGHAGALGIEGKGHDWRHVVGAVHAGEGRFEGLGVLGNGMPVGDDGTGFLWGEVVLVSEMGDHVAAQGLRDGVGKGGELVGTVCLVALDQWGTATGIIIVVVICRVVAVRHFGFEGCCIAGLGCRGKGGLKGEAAVVLGCNLIGFPFLLFLCILLVVTLVGVSLQVCQERRTSSNTSTVVVEVGGLATVSQSISSVWEMRGIIGALGEHARGRHLALSVT